MPFLSRAEAIDRLRALVRSAGKSVPSPAIPRALAASLRHHWGSLRAARYAANVAPVAMPRRWSLERVVAEVRRIHRQGTRIALQDLIEAGRWDLAHAIRIYAGGFPRARRLARVPDPPRRRREHESWSEERVIEEILELHEDGKSLATTRAPANLVHTGVRLFGSWRAAITAAGLDYRTIRLRPEYGDDELLDALRRLAARRPHLTVGELRKLALGKTVARRFPSIEKAARHAGLVGWPVRLAHPVLSRAATLAALRARRREGKPLSQAALGRSDGRLLHSVRRHFGGIPGALAAGGIPRDTPERQPWTAKTIARHLRARRQRGEPINAGAIERDLPGLYRAAKRLFGSYYAVARRYGAKRQTKTWPREATLKELRSVARKNHGVVRAKDIGFGVLSACLRHFGSFDAARRAAGVSGTPPRWTRERVIRELRAAERKRPPNSRKGPMLIPVLREAARRLFGGINDARKAAGLAPLE